MKKIISILCLLITINVSAQITTGSIPYAVNSYSLGYLPIGTANQYLGVVGGLPTWTTVATSATFSVNTQTASYTLATSDANNLVRMSVSADAQVLVPNSSRATYNIGDVITVQRYGIGRINFVEDNAVNIKSANRKLSIYGENGVVFLKKTGANEWELSGDTDWIWDFDFKQFNSRLVNKIPDAQSSNLNLFITGLKNYNGVDSLNYIFDYQYFFGGLATQSNANLNVISSSYSITTSSTPPTWGVNGYTGGSTKYLKNGFNDKAKGKALSLNDEVMYAYCNTDPGGTLEMEMGNFDDASYNTLNTCLSSNYSGNARGAVSNKAQTSNTATTVTSGIGLTAVERKGNNVILWKNGSIISSGVFVPDSLESQENYILAVKYGTATAGLRFSTKEVFSVGKGSAYNLDQADFYNRLYNYRNGYTAPPKTPVGTIFYDYFNSGSLSSNYSNTSGAWSVSGGHAVATNTTASMWTKPLTYTLNSYTCGFERTIMDLYEVVDNTSSKGVAISYNGLYNNLQVLFNFSTNKIEYYNSVGTNTLSASTSTLAISTNDVIHIKVRDHQGMFTTTVYNVTQGTNMKFVYDYGITYSQTNIRPSAYQPTLYACGGTQNVTYWSFSGQSPTNADVAFIGDSNFFRFYQQYKDASIPNQLGAGHSWFNYGGPGLKTGDINWSEVVAANPKQVVINLGTNDIYNGISVATATANIQTGVTALENAGIKVIICKIPHLNAADVRPYNTQLATTFGSRVGPDLFAAFPSSVSTPYQWLDGTYTPDYIHFNLLAVPIVVSTISPYITWTP